MPQESIPEYIRALDAKLSPINITPNNLAREVGKILHAPYYCNISLPAEGLTVKQIKDRLIEKLKIIFSNSDIMYRPIYVRISNSADLLTSWNSDSVVIKRGGELDAHVMCTHALGYGYITFYRYMAEPYKLEVVFNEWKFGVPKISKT